LLCTQQNPHTNQPQTNQAHHQTKAHQNHLKRLSALLKIFLPMQQLNIYEAKTHFSQLLESVSKGESVVIAKSGKPIARLVPFSVQGSASFEFGSLKGQITVSDDFDAPLSDDVLDLFEAD